MSAFATSLRRIARPSSLLRFSVTLFTPRLLVSKKVLPMPGSTVMRRDGSPPWGDSILMTSAPRSAISIQGTVPACAVEQETTLTPCSGPWGRDIDGAPL
jgi:hypothetical protein